MIIKTTFIISLSEAQADVLELGGKGASLARLASADLPVPGAFAISTSAYRYYVASHDLQGQIMAAAAAVEPQKPETFEEAAQRIHGLFARYSLPKDLISEISEACAVLGGDSPVAVRSSATAEDLPDLSFAGQQETYLNVRGLEAVVEAVRRCWASLWTARAIAYRLRQKIDSDSIAMSVIVQRLIVAEAAGVMFTANPSNGKRSEIVINAAWGLGESIVSGAVTPDTLIIDKTTGHLLQRQTAEKQAMTILTESGTLETLVPDELKHKAVLSDAQAAELARYGVQIENLYGRPMDIEWALGNGNFAILQARPVTALPESAVEEPVTWPKPGRGEMYGRTSFAEQLPNPVSPLFGTLGLRMADIPTQELMKRFTTAKIKYTYVPINGYVYMVAGMSLPEFIAYIRMSVQITPMVLHGKERCEAARREFIQVIRTWAEKDISALAPSELLSGAGTLFQAAVRLYTHMQAGTVPLSTFSEASFTQFYNRLVRRPGDPAAATFLYGSETVALNAEKALFDLAAWVRQHPCLADYLRQSSAAQAAQNLPLYQPPSGVTLEDWTEWRGQFQAYLAEHGQMTYDLDFVNPVPAEQPSALLETIKMYLQGGGSNPYARHQSALQRRTQAAERIVTRLHWPLKGWFQRLLRWAQENAPGRENSLADLGLGHPIIRRYLNELGRRLAAGGAIPNAESIYWLEEAEVQELVAALEANQPLANLSSRIPPRRAEWQRYLKATPPAILPEKSKWSILVPWHRTSDDRSMLHGIGTSAGQVTAPACVLVGPQDFARMRPGDILVAATTTPAWTPLFAMAAGVVTDIGGPLSHSSIVAREYGIPAVMATGSATRRILNGQIIMVDGTHGTVILKN